MRADQRRIGAWYPLRMEQNLRPLPVSSQSRISWAGRIPLAGEAPPPGGPYERSCRRPHRCAIIGLNGGYDHGAS